MNSFFVRWCILENIFELIKEFSIVITSVTTIIIAIKKILVEPINKRITSLELSSIRTDLVNFINDVESDVKKSEIQKLNAHQLYTRYENLGGNSYVHSHWEELKKEGKI